MKSILIIILIVINISIYSQNAGSYPRILGRENWPFCENEIKVKDAKSATCSPDNCHSYMFPVINEEFDNNYDLPNKWTFDYGKDNGADLANTTYLREGYYDSNGNITNHNVQVVNGMLKIVSTYEASHGYNFTSGLIKSLNQFEYGTFEARIKIPSANKMFPAFWLLNKINNYSEIDIFEFEDGNTEGSPCNTYNDHRMTLHVGSVPNANECIRGDKYPMSGIENFHVYRLEWNQYETSIYVDGQKKGYATKFYDRTKWDINSCHYSRPNHIDPLYSYNCNTIQGLEDNWYETWWPEKPGNWPWWLPWPNTPRILYYPNKIKEDSYFPNKYRPMQVIINNIINEHYKSENFSEFSQEAQIMYIDWVRIYQGFCCGIDKTIYTNADFNNQTNYTSILTGRKLKFGNINTSQFSQYKPGSAYKPGTTDIDWTDFPVFLLATDEIEINGESIFPGDTYAEMRITDCNGSVARLHNSDDTGNSANNWSQGNIESDIEDVSSNPKLSENFIIDIYPVPTTDEVNIKCDTETFDQISSIHLIDINGNKFEVNRSHTISLELFKAGYYHLMITLKNYSIIYKKIIKI